jgi:hypothetical protein
VNPVDAATLTLLERNREQHRRLSTARRLVADMTCYCGLTPAGWRGAIVECDRCHLGRILDGDV